jgi:aminoglycoside 6-adenylyltransferase
MKMLNWEIGIRYDFKVTTGGHGKYLKRYLTEEEMKRVQDIFPNGDYEDIWNKLFLMFDYFEELASEVAKHFNFTLDKAEAGRVREFLALRKSNL